MPPNAKFRLRVLDSGFSSTISSPSLRIGLNVYNTLCIFFVQLINTPPIRAMLLVLVLFTFLCPSEEKPSAEGMSVLDVSTLKSCPETKHS